METATFQAIPVENIKPSSHQARKDFNPDAIQTLADSMKLEGLIQPIVVRPVNGSFELVAGERRFRAAKLLQWPTIDAKVVATGSEGEAAAKGLVENLQRQDLNPIEEAEGFQQLSQIDPYWTQEKIAQVSGKTQGYISQSFKVLGLPDPVKESIRRLILSRSHALELLALPPEKQQEAADQVVKQNLNLKQTRQLVAKMQGGAKDKGPATGKPAEDLAWKGEEIAINRHYKPAGESVQDYIAWLTQALPAFAETKPVGKHGHPIATKAPIGVPSDAALAEKMVEPVRQAEQAMLDTIKPRLPQNADEEAELQRIAETGGPVAVYEWIYGKGSFMVQAVPFKTWQEAGCSAADGLKQILDGIKQFQATAVA